MPPNTTSWSEVKLTRIVAGALRSAMNDHGPIGEEQMGSAAKRVAGQLKGEVGGWLDERIEEA